MTMIFSRLFLLYHFRGTYCLLQGACGFVGRYVYFSGFNFVFLVGYVFFYVSLSVHGGDALPVKRLPESWGHFSLASFMRGMALLAGRMICSRTPCASVLDMA